MASSKFHVRSISFPSRSHPTTLRTEEELIKLKTWEASSTSASGSICDGLSGLEDLYGSVEDLLGMASAREVLSKHRQERCVNDLLDESMKLLDICGIARDVMFRCKEQVQALQSAFRRKKGDSSIRTSVANYKGFMKKMKKDARKLIFTLKQMENKFGPSPALDQDHHLSAVIRILREVNVMNSSIFQSLLSFLSKPVSKQQKSKWSLVSKLILKGSIACKENQENVNELQNAEAALTEGLDLQTAHKRLEALESSIEDLENCLESVFRRLIKTRASLLNIFSQSTILDKLVLALYPMKRRPNFRGPAKGTCIFQMKSHLHESEL